MNKQLKSTLFLLALPLFFWTSCQKEADLIPATAETQTKISQVNSIAVQHDQREVFSLLSPEEKQDAWRQHFGHAQRQLGTTPVRSELISRMQAWNDEKNMFADADYLALLNTVRFKEWEAEARKVFSIEEIFYIVSSLDIEYKGMDGIPNVGGGIGPAGGDVPSIDCECMHVAGSTLSCPYVSYTISATPYITIKEGVCPIDKNCTQKRNCGWWWGSMCNGMCSPA
jgi:hypothetical protein